MTSAPRLRNLTLLLAAAALLATGCGSSDGGKDKASSAKPACDYITTGKPARKVTKPSSDPTTTGSVEVTMKTNFGSVPITLDADKTPCAVNSFLSLSEQHYYDKTACSRIAYDSRGFALVQCGDPSGTGAGDPGYRFKEEVDGKETYTSGTVAMAKTDQPASTGGQFFVILGDTQLPPQYTVIGKLSDKGLAVMRKAGTAGLKGKTDGYDGKPATKIEILSVARS